jgi:hypothetical protein
VALAQAATRRHIEHGFVGRPHDSWWLAEIDH